MAQSANLYTGCRYRPAVRGEDSKKIVFGRIGPDEMSIK